jgi:hypothetical protein
VLAYLLDDVPVLEPDYFLPTIAEHLAEEKCKIILAQELVWLPVYGIAAFMSMARLPAALNFNSVRPELVVPLLIHQDSTQ